ncbi:macrophage migration inhibitory factor-like isoform X1 [Panulirus ornatus]|uniref:macrophage migration inhibitory factor-like isoform X1 n=1 Tax=Panulirus ornatus TaxID=150431 RepID=UPI003A842B9B
MPSLEIATNVPKDKVTPTLLLELSKVFSATVSKSEQYCCVRVVPDQLMTFGGSTEPCALAVLHCIGELGVEENKAHAAKIYEFMEKNLGIPSDSIVTHPSQKLFREREREKQNDVPHICGLANIIGWISRNHFS